MLDLPAHQSLCTAEFPITFMSVVLVVAVISCFYGSERLPDELYMEIQSERYMGIQSEHYMGIQSEHYMDIQSEHYTDGYPIRA